MVYVSGKVLGIAGQRASLGIAGIKEDLLQGAFGEKLFWDRLPLGL